MTEAQALKHIEDSAKKSKDNLSKAVGVRDESEDEDDEGAADFMGGDPFEGL